VTPQPTEITTLADQLVDRLFGADPFSASELGLRQYDAEVPDDSREGHEALRQEIGDIRARANASAPAAAAETVTKAVIRSTCDRTLAELENARVEYLVTAMPMDGPPSFLATAARTVLSDPAAARAYVTRLRRSAAWIDTRVVRLADGRARGRLPVASLVDQAIAWTDATLAEQLPSALTTAKPPSDWDGESSWREERDRAITDAVRPALARWRATLVDLLPDARSDEAAGMGSIPGGDADYLRDILIHTTLPVTADELHDIGLATVDQLEERSREVGATLRLADRGAILAALRLASSAVEPATALSAAVAAIRRAEAAVIGVLPDPLPAPCAIEPMPPTVADAGMPPHYTRPRRDGTRPGTYWFNTRRPTAGTGWDLEAVAFHEAVPGHHSQHGRVRADLPRLQTLLSVTAHSEGWGLYAEQLAGELSLYSDARAELGALAMQMHRAARLVVDTGLHARGWSRQRAIDYLVAHVPLPAAFLTNEVDRYLAWPGQALAYLTGLREIRRLRDEARGQLGPAFQLPGFHAAVLDSGSLPLPVLAEVVHDWTATSRTSAKG
jgi:uncharacterized protein (DUF885 family)